MTKRRLRSFNDANFKKQLALIKGELPNAMKLKKSLVAFAGCNNLDEINEYLNGKTGFLNAPMSASAMGLDMQYFIVTSYIDKIDFSLYNKSLTDVAPDVIKRLKEENSTYYSEEETKILSKAEKITKALNEIPVGLRQSVFLNSYKDFVFDEKKFNYLLQIQGRS
jgi:hypothetical protein